MHFGPMKRYESSKKDELTFSEFLVSSIFYYKCNSLKADESQNSAQMWLSFMWAHQNVQLIITLVSEGVGSVGGRCGQGKTGRKPVFGKLVSGRTVF